MHLLTRLLFPLLPPHVYRFSSVCTVHADDNTLQAPARTSADGDRLRRVHRRRGRHQARLSVRSAAAGRAGHRNRLEPRPRLGWRRSVRLHRVPLDTAVQDHEIQPAVGNDLMIQNQVQQGGRLQCDIGKCVAAVRDVWLIGTSLHVPRLFYPHPQHALQPLKKNQQLDSPFLPPPHIFEIDQ